MKTKIKNIIADSIDVKSKILNNENLVKEISYIVNVCIESLKKGGSIYWCGNGGSVADAQHLSAELTGKFYFDREPLSSIALHCNTSYLTAISNDYGYEFVYSRLIKAIGKRGDVLIGLSTSGNSMNIIKAFETAFELGMKTVGLTGGTKSKLNPEFLIKIPSSDIPRIQESHITIGHIICQLIEEKMFKK